MARLSKSYRQLTPVKKIAFAYTVYQNMSTKEKFNAQKSQINKLKTDLDAYQVAAAEAAWGGTDRILVKNNCLKAVTEDLDLLSSHVEITTLTDESVADDSGFQLIVISRTKAVPKEPVTELRAPSNCKVLNLEKSGAVVASCDEMPDAILYQIGFLRTEETAWNTDTYSNMAKGIILSGFNKFSRVKFMLRGISETGVVGDWSNIVEVSVD